MNLAKLQHELIAAARANRPSDHVPYAFEKRIMACLPGRPALDEWALWGRALWRAAAPCLAVMLLLGAWSVLAPATPTPATDLAQDFDNTVLAAVDQEQTFDATW
jgi:hypothetical protein